MTQKTINLAQPAARIESSSRRWARDERKENRGAMQALRICQADGESEENTEIEQVGRDTFL